MLTDAASPLPLAGHINLCKRVMGEMINILCYDDSGGDAAAVTSHDRLNVLIIM